MGGLDAVLNDPNSPSARIVNGSGRESGQFSISHSPLVPKEPPLGACWPSTSPPLPPVTGFRPSASLPFPLPASFTSFQSTSSFHLRCTSPGAHVLSIPTSQQTSPVPPHSENIPYGVSPAASNPSRPLPAQSYPASAPSKTAATVGPNVKGKPSAQSLIPCVLDRKSGSSSQAKKRKTKSEASQRFRSRKRNEMQLEQHLNRQKDEILRHTDALRQQADMMRALIQQRDHYRSERNFFRSHVSRSVSLDALSSRRLSPRLPADTGATSTESTLSAPTLPVHPTQASVMLDTSQREAIGQVDILRPAINSLLRGHHCLRFKAGPGHKGD
ncbi:unnamed protein product [Penicillium pancosmium]